MTDVLVTAKHNLAIFTSFHSLFPTILPVFSFIHFLDLMWFISQLSQTDVTSLGWGVLVFQENTYLFTHGPPWMSW